MPRIAGTPLHTTGSQPVLARSWQAASGAKISGRSEVWSFALVASGLIFMYGMTTIEPLVATDQARAVLTWQAVEPVALALGGAGGEILGGLWVLLVSVVVLRDGGLPKALGWLGLAIGVVGITSIVPLLSDATVVFGLLEIAWFAWVGVVLVVRRNTSERPMQVA